MYSFNKEKMLDSHYALNILIVKITMFITQASIMCKQFQLILLTKSMSLFYKKQLFIQQTQNKNFEVLKHSKFNY